MPTRTFVEELEFDLSSALLTALIELLEEMPTGNLREEVIQQVDEAQGVYQLFLDGDLVYIGKTDAAAGLQKRLMRHAKKVQWREELDVDAVTFKAIRLYVFTPMDIEESLIKHFKDAVGALPWQNSGFGANDPGRDRDTTNWKAEHFDVRHPIDLNRVVTLEGTGETVPVATVLVELKKRLPYLIRFEGASRGSRKPHPEPLDKTITLLQATDTALRILQQIKSALGDDWRITALPGYVILYRRDNKRYHRAQDIGPFVS